MALILLFALERYLPRLPGGLIVLVTAIAVSAGLGLAGHGVKVIGTIPTGLPAVSWPHLRLDDLWVLLPSAAGMMLVIFSEALGAGQAFADKHGYRLDSSQEMIALGGRISMLGDDPGVPEQLGKLADYLSARNVALGLAHVHGPALEMARRSGLLAQVGDHVFPTTPAAVAWARSVADTPATEVGNPAGRMEQS